MDFVCRDGHKVTLLIQVAYSISQEKTLARETTALQEASKEFRCDNRMILTCDDTAVTADGIMIKTVTDWLTER